MKRLLAAVVLVPALAACSLLPLSTLGPQDVVARQAAQARQVWLSQGIRSYTFRVERQCFCPPEWSGPFTVTVVDGVTTLVTYRGAPAAAEKIEHIPKTIDAVFDLLIANSATTLDVTFDPNLGFPTAFSVDPIKNEIDDEFNVSVTNFQPLS